MQQNSQRFTFDGGAATYFGTALLGAILVNNDAYYRVSDFLKPDHLYEPLHRKIFEVASEIIRMGKTANPVTIKTFLPADQKVGGRAA